MKPAKTGEAFKLLISDPALKKPRSPNSFEFLGLWRHSSVWMPLSKSENAHEEF
jgi:hypothetical protein